MGLHQMLRIDGTEMLRERGFKNAGIDGLCDLAQDVLLGRHVGGLENGAREHAFPTEAQALGAQQILGTASSIEIWSTAQGAVSQLASNAFTVAGMTMSVQRLMGFVAVGVALVIFSVEGVLAQRSIRTDSNTVFDGLASVAAMTPGLRVTVWSLQAGADGQDWIATRVALASGSAVVSTGVISSMDSGTFVNGLRLTGSSMGQWMAGDMVRVQGVLSDSGDSIAVTSSRIMGPGLSFQPDGEVEIEGLVTATSPPGRFMLGRFDVDASAVAFSQSSSPIVSGMRLKVAALDAEEFKVLLESVIYRPGIRAALIHGDGVPFLMAPNGKDVEGLDLVKPDSFFVKRLGSGRNANVFSGVFNYVGDERMVALQTVQDPSLSMDKPMVIVVDRRLQAMYANWKHEVFEYGLSFAILASLMSAALLRNQRQRRLVAHASEQSQDEQFRFVRLPGDLDQKTRTANDAHVGKTRWEMGAENLSEADWTSHRITLQTYREFHDFEILRRNQDGSPRWISVSGMPMFNALGNFTGYRGVARDITVQKLSEEHIKHFAFYDGLTKLPNRCFLNDRMLLEFAASKRNQRYGAALFLDLDNFKPLNDKFGHEFGDLLLVEVANRLLACVREVDTVARFGGDEFVVTVGNLDAARDESMAQANRVAEKIRLSLAEPYRLSLPQDASGVATIEHRCTVSIGITLFFGHEQSAQEILKQADTAMYEAKQAGRNAIRFYEAKAGPRHSH